MGMKFLSNFTIFSSIVWAVAIGNIDVTIAQETECARTGPRVSTDRGCIEQSLLNFCNMRSSDYDTCLNWMEELLSSNRSSPNLVYELYIGLAHQALAYLSADEQTRGRHRTEAMNIYKLIVQKDPNNVDARYGISSLSEPGEKIEQYQKILEIQPDDSYAGRSLATNINRAHQDSRAGNLEAAILLESVFDNMDESRSKWSIAGTIVGYLERGEYTSEIVRFKEKSIRLLSPDDKLGALSQLSVSSPELVYSVPVTLCYQAVIRIAGSDYCFDSLDLLIGSIPEINPPQDLLQAYSQVISDSVSNTFDQTPSRGRKIEDWRETFAEQYESNVIGSGDNSSRAYYTLFTLLKPGDPRKLTAISNAVESESDSVMYNIALGSYLLELRRPAEALSQFRKTAALETFSEQYKLQLDSLMGVAESTLRN